MSVCGTRFVLQSGGLTVGNQVAEEAEGALEGEMRPEEAAGIFVFEVAVDAA